MTTETSSKLKGNLGKKIDLNEKLDNKITEIHPKNDFIWFLANHPEVRNMPIERQLDEYRSRGISSYTWFYREPPVMDTFKELILPGFSKDKTIRVASVGCSLGGEPYGILLSNWAERDRLAIDAFDCNLDTLESAMMRDSYAFDEWELENLKDNGKNNIEEAGELTFNPKASFVRYELKLKPKTKKRVNFEPLDIFSEKLPREYDAIFLLNVLKYYQPKGRKIILDNIHRSLAEGGWLLGELEENQHSSEEYRKFMQDLSSFGFEKQKVVLNSKDITQGSRVYRRR
ncbi:MAG: CheR family methyltransferase [Nanoarchaeota archaeon]|nr:CheR family methyltransferase [Nanoarchaeota archaeon]